jgi:hypothetical protein
VDGIGQKRVSSDGNKGQRVSGFRLSAASGNDGRTGEDDLEEIQENGGRKKLGLISCGLQMRVWVGIGFNFTWVASFQFFNWAGTVGYLVGLEKIGF